MLLFASSFEELGVDPFVAPGWSRAMCAQRKAFLVRVDETTAWVAAVDPNDITVVDDLAWLTRRHKFEVFKISEELLAEAMQKLYGTA